jgi:phage terminase Nu1 subunit (DNA packaging protein)
MSRALTERRLFDTAQRLRAAREELAVLDAQLAELAETAEEARVRSLVSETPLAHREHAEAQRHVDALARARRSLEASVRELSASQDELLDRLLADDAGRQP